MLPRLRILTLAGVACLTTMFVWSASLRLAYPYELEWMTGSILDHVERARAGLPIYAAPTTRWIPFLYTPLYYWVAGIFTDSFFGCRLVSLAAALIQAICIYRLVFKSTASRYWAIVATGFFFACFSYTGNWYDLERPDTLCMAIVLVASVVLIEWKNAFAVVAAALLMGLAFLAKQQAAVFVLGAAAGLVFERRLRQAASFTFVATLTIGITSFALDAKTGGWFSYYVFKIPAKHGILLRLFSNVFEYDVPFGIVLVTATIVMVAGHGLSTRHRLFTSLLVAGALGALSSRLHIGGWVNVLQVWTGFACVAVAVVAARIEASLAAGDPKRARTLGIALHAALLGQLALWVYDPREGRIAGDWRHFGALASEGPGPALATGNAQFAAIVRRLEARGEVLVVSRGHVTTPRHFQMAALADVVPMSGAPADLTDVISRRSLAAIVDDARKEGDRASPLWPPVMMEDIPALRTLLFANYFVAERIDDSLLRIPMASPAAPRWIYLPRAHPLADIAEDALDVRHAREMRLAELRAESIRKEENEPFSIDAIEDRAGTDRQSP